MATVTIRTGRNSVKTIVGKRVVQLDDKKQKLIDAFVFWRGKYDEFPTKQRHYIFPMKDVLLAPSSIIHISGNLITHYID